MSINVTVIEGNLGANADIRAFGSGDGVASFSLASTTSYTDKAGNRQEKTTWVPCKLFGSQARMAYAEQVLLKGARFVVQGTLEEESWQAKDTNQKVTRLVLKVSSFVPASAGSRAAAPQPAPAYSGADHQDFDFS